LYQKKNENIINSLSIIPFVSSIFLKLKYDFRPCKKNLKNNPGKKKLFEKGPWPHIFYDMAWGLPRGSC